MVRSAALLLAIFLLGACAQYDYDLGDALSASQLPDPGQELHLGEVLQQLGPPLRISASPVGYVLAWEHWDIKERKLGFSLGFAGADLLSVDLGNARAKGEFLLLGFNHEHKLTDASFTEWDNETGGGKAIQPLASLVSVVDVDDLLEAMPHHRWGASSLQVLPKTLNAQSQPDTGQNGLEQRGTPTTVGQRSLELD